MNLMLKPKRYILAVGVLVALLLALIGLNPRCSVGPVTIESVSLINQPKPKWPYPGNMSTFQNQEGVFCAIQTSGVDTIIRTQWFYEGTLLKEIVVRTQSNRAIAGLSPPLEAGNYRITIALVDGFPLRTRDFTVRKYKPTVFPPQPVPDGHVDWEDDKLHASVPFAFDEVWSIDGTDWQANEVKVVFLADSVVVSVVVLVDFDPLGLSDEARKALGQPIALYALRHGYIAKAKSLQIDGQTRVLKNLVVALLYPQTGQGYRVSYDFDELKALLNGP